MENFICNKKRHFHEQLSYIFSISQFHIICVTFYANLADVTGNFVC